MSTRVTIRAARTGADLEDVARLFKAYAATLPIALDYQDFSAEVSQLPGKYAPPSGELLVARSGSGDTLGCVGVRPLAEASACEMKRLYVLPNTRGTGLGRALAEAAITTARRLGYAEIRLDTLPTMSSAQALYAGLGFHTRPAYYSPTPPGTIFMSMRL